jgi:pimeloyl-ACP methyl ester carboxylesterase
MSRSFAGILIAAALLAAPATASAKVPPGPAGAAFYTPTAAVPTKHGSPIWARAATAGGVLSAAKSNTLLLYSSTSVDGKPVAVSGTVSVPKTKAPKSGWPVVSWAHGTTGIADQCAPSMFKIGYTDKLLNSWLKAGYAVVQTDYEGLGTPGPHPYLVGTSEGRSVLDMVRAARALNPKIGKSLLVAGHSQGGHAALWAGSLAPKWTPELKLHGTLALAPASHLGEQGQLLSALTTPSGLSGLAAMIVRGIDIADPQLNVQSQLSDQAKALYPQIDTKCLPDLGKPDSFGGIAPANLFVAGANLNPFIAALNANDPETLKIKGPVQIEQGKADTTVIPAFTDQLSVAYHKAKLDVTYKTYPGLEHSDVVTKSAPAKAATAFVEKDLG